MLRQTSWEASDHLPMSDIHNHCKCNLPLWGGKLHRLYQLLVPNNCSRAEVQLVAGRRQIAPTFPHIDVNNRRTPEVQPAARERHVAPTFRCNGAQQSANATFRRRAASCIDFYPHRCPIIGERRVCDLMPHGGNVPRGCH